MADNPAAFKHRIDAEAVRTVGERIRSVHPDFDLPAFQARATGGLQDLELKARVAHVADALRHELPPAWPEAVEILVAALPEPLPDASEVSSGFAWWPVLHCVQVHGLDHPEPSLDALHPMTRRFSAEFAIRPYLIAHPELAWARVHRWVTDPDVHVRRLCSEGTRPRLPWGVRLRDAVDDPSRGLEVLDRLVDDPEPYVRTSVANHLNDVSKDHPERAVQVARRWLAQPDEARRWIVARGLRTLVKRGDPAALELLGFGLVQAELQALGVRPYPARIGGSTELSATLLPGADQRWLVDWIVRAPRADGTLGHRVLKGKQLDVRASEPVTVRQRLSLRPVTTRVTRPGTWAVAVQVNGTVLGEVSFEVAPDTPTGPGA